MRKLIVNIFATTGISLILLSMIALFFHGTYIWLQTIFQVWGINLIIHLGLICLSRLELKHNITEMVSDIALIISVLIISGFMFGWFTSTPIWILVIMGIVIYIVSAILNLLYMKREAEEINALIKGRDSKKKQ